MFYYGVDYYPEHWPDARWGEDARLMQEAGINVVRLAEFAWSRLEPRDGQFDFAWLDRALEVLGARGIKAVLGTPTASPPPWLMAAHPECYLVEANGARNTYGNRRQYCPTNAAYRDCSARVVRAMAEHYKAHPQVIGWQIDNEFGDRCYCPECQRAFQAWLKARYGTLDELNARWGTIFWSHVYADWSQIPLPWTTSRAPNPGLALDYCRFMSDTYVSYQQAQIDILRPTCPEHFITHNFMGFGYDRINYFDLARPLDQVAWDNYPRGFWNMREKVDPADSALGHDTMRGLKGRNFWVMEAQSGATGWEVVGLMPRPGEIRLWAYQAVAHGADAMVFFRWRTCRFGTEEYWHGVLDHDARPRRRYAEVKQLGQELARIADAIVGAEVRADAAIVLSYDSRFAFQIQPNNPAFNFSRHVADYYAALHARNVPVDIVPPLADLSAYKLVIAPALYVLSAEEAANLRRFVEVGGVLVVTARSGVKDEANTVVDMALPGLLADVCGVEVEEYDSLPAGATNPVEFVHPEPISAGARGAARIWCDVLGCSSAEAAARYTQDYYAGQPAITVNRYGHGWAIYVGTFGDQDMVKSVVNWATGLANVKPAMETPAGVEAAARWKGDQRLLFVLNHDAQPHRVSLADTYLDLISGAHKSGEVSLAGREVLILVKEG